MIKVFWSNFILGDSIMSFISTRHDSEESGVTHIAPSGRHEMESLRYRRRDNW